jgi:hypothetical protein
VFGDELLCEIRKLVVWTIQVRSWSVPFGVENPHFHVIEMPLAALPLSVTVSVTNYRQQLEVLLGVR